MQFEEEPPPSIYRALSDQSEIRLVILAPSTRFEHPIECRLEHAIIGNCKPFEALSYVWGKPDFTKVITLDDQKVRITERLAAVLRHLRLPRQERTLWIDAICINQRDLAERQEQVGYFRDIYSSCSSDILWLSPGNQDSSEGMSVVRQLVELQRKWKEGGKEAEDGWLERRLSDRIKEADAEKLERLLNHESVWKRVWIMQEISCAPKVILRCGYDTLDWALVEEVIRGGLHYTDAFHGAFGHGFDPSKAWVVTFCTAKFIANQREAVTRMHKGENSTLLDVLARFKHTESTDPRDKIYALLGLVNDKTGVEVNYEKSVVQTYVDVALALINSSANLDILCQCPWEAAYRIRDLRPLEGLPNWVPDFRVTQNGRFLFAQRGIYSAGRAQCSVPCTVQGSAILLNGYCLGQLRVSRGVPAPNVRNARGKHLSIIVRDWAYINLTRNEAGGIGKREYRTGEDQLQAFWRTLVGDCTGYPQRRLTPDEVQHDQHVIEELVHDDVDDRVRFNTLSFHMLERLVLKEGWRFYISNNGLFVLAQYAALAGDVMAVLDGAKVPMVLRPTGQHEDGHETYWPICGAYVHGFMDGEAMESESGFREKVFHIT